MDQVNPLLLFPLEVWEMILDRVYDSETVYRVLQIYPQLDEAFQKKKHQWLLGKILPFITIWSKLLKEEELLKCRLACKNFQRAVDNFLENQQPHFRPYYPDLQSDDQFSWNSKAHFRQHVPPRKRYFGGVKLHLGRTGDYMSYGGKFLYEMGKHPENRNPFLARSLSVALFAGGWNETEEQRGRKIQFLKKVREVLEKWGEHIWFLSIHFSVRRQHHDQTWDWLTGSLALLPNLKSLDLYLATIPDWSTREEKNAVEANPTPINFPPLESLRASGSALDSFAIRIVSGINPPLRRLVLNFGSWREEYSQLLSTVTEFKLESLIIETEEDWTRFSDLMLSLEAPQLARLEMNPYFARSMKPQPPISIEDDIFPWIRRFPSLKYFGIGNPYDDLVIQEKGTLSPERDSLPLPGLQFLSIRDSFALSYDFLRCMPSLQHLQLQSDSNPSIVDLSNERVVRIREQIETGTMHRSNIWELLPNLRSVSIMSRSRGSRREFACNREKYSYFKEHPDYQGFDEFREDIGITLWADSYLSDLLLRQPIRGFPQDHRMVLYDVWRSDDVDEDGDSEDTGSPIDGFDPEDNNSASNSDAD